MTEEGRQRQLAGLSRGRETRLANLAERLDAAAGETAPVRMCRDCGKRPAEKRSDRPGGFRGSCHACKMARNPALAARRSARESARGSGRLQRRRKLLGGIRVCESCGFVPMDLCQLDMDHIDGNHENNQPENLQVLCANCHRLKTKRNGEGIYRR